MLPFKYVLASELNSCCICTLSTDIGCRFIHLWRRAQGDNSDVESLLWKKYLSLQDKLKSFKISRFLHITQFSWYMFPLNMIWFHFSEDFKQANWTNFFTWQPRLCSGIKFHTFKLVLNLTEIGDKACRTPPDHENTISCISWQYWIVTDCCFIYSSLSQNSDNTTRFTSGNSLQAQVPICGWLMAIRWCVTSSGCRGWLLRCSSYFLYGDIGLFWVQLEILWNY